MKGGETHFYIKALGDFSPVAQLVSPQPTSKLTQMFCLPWLVQFLVKLPMPKAFDEARHRLIDVMPIDLPISNWYLVYSCESETGYETSERRCHGHGAKGCGS